MTPTVTISLQEYEDLKNELKESREYASKLNKKIITIKQDILKEMFGETEDIAPHSISVYRDRTPFPPYDEKVITLRLKLPKGRSTLFEEGPPSYKMSD